MGLFIFSHSYRCQKINNELLADHIEKYNNRGEYKKAQDTLLNLLENTEGESKIIVLIQLSNTYKRLQDYSSVIGFLLEGKKLAKEDNLSSYKNIINAHLAFAYFDTQDFPKAKK
jgi:hypothetical protein